MKYDPTKTDGDHLLLSKLWSFISPRRKIHFLFLSFLTVGCAFIEMVSLGAVVPFLGVLSDPSSVMSDPRFKSFFELFNITKHLDFVLIFSVLFIALAIISGLARLLLLWCSNKVAFAAGADIGIQMIENILKQPYEAHLVQNSSATVTAFVSHINAAVFWIIIPIITFVSSTAVIVFIIGALIYIVPAVSMFVIAALAIIYVIVAVASRKKLNSNSEILKLQQEEMVKALQESVQTFREIRLYDLDQFFAKRYREADLKVRNAHCWNNFIGGLPRPIMEAFGMVSVGALAISFTFNETGLTAAIPVLGAIAIAGQRVLPAAQQMFSAWVYIAAGRSSLREVIKTLDCGDRDASDVELLRHESIDEISLQDVFYKFKGSKSFILKGINLTVKKGQFVGIVGKSGSGKSTIINILLGFLKVKHGRINVNGVPFKPSQTKGLQKFMASVPQEVQLLDQSLSDNVALGIEPENICSKTVMESIKISQLEPFLKRMGAADDARLGERGITVSGGERQRLGIARALYRGRTIIILDEATSALDSITEKKFMDSLRKKRDDLTIVMVAHRLSTLESCDVIYEIEDGKVINSGTYDEMVKSSELFKTLNNGAGANGFS